MSLIYDIPSPVEAGVAKAIFGGWQIGAVTILQSGAPFNVNCTQAFIPIRDSAGNITGNSGCDFNADGFNNDFMNVASFGSEFDHSRQSFLTRVFSPGDFAKPGFGQNGSLARNAFIGPGFNSTDMNITRKFPAPFLGEAGRIDFRAEFFNLFNRVNLQNPQGEIRNSNFGRSTSSFGARNIQFGLKLVF
jgi:hypothetical protein